MLVCVVVVRVFGGRACGRRCRNCVVVDCVLDEEAEGRGFEFRERKFFFFSFFFFDFWERARGRRWVAGVVWGHGEGAGRGRNRWCVVVAVDVVRFRRGNSGWRGCCGRWSMRRVRWTCREWGCHVGDGRGRNVVGGGVATGGVVVGGGGRSWGGVRGVGRGRGGGEEAAVAWCCAPWCFGCPARLKRGREIGFFVCVAVVGRARACGGCRRLRAVTLEVRRAACAGAVGEARTC